MRVLITGASSGIGRALALEYAASGADVVAFGRDIARLDAVAAECRERGASVATFAVAVEDTLSMKEAVLAAEEAEPLDIVIANAGIGGRQTLAGSRGESDAVAEALVDVNFRGVLNTVRPIVPAMMERRRGRLALVSSLAGLRGLPDSPIYSASKAAVRVYGEGLRPLLRPFGITVSVVVPGYVDTEMSRSLPFSRPLLISPQAMAARIRRGIARGTGRITAPFALGLAMNMLTLMPHRLADPLLERFRMYGDDGDDPAE